MIPRERFMVAEIPGAGAEILVILIDYHFWSDNIGELIEWCSHRNATTEGMTVVLGDDLTLTEFLLRWA